MSLVIKCCVIVLIVTVAFTTAGEERTPRNGMTLDLVPKTTFQEGEKKGRVAILVERKRVEIGKRFRVTISIANLTKQTLPVHNALLTGMIDRYVTLALFDADRKYVGDLLLQSVSGSRLSSSLHHLNWCAVPPKAIHEVRHTFVAGSIYRYVIPSLPPGRYYLQLIVDRRFISDSPKNLPYLECGTDPASEEYFDYLVRLQELRTEAKEDGKSLRRFEEGWEKTNPPGELVRSNVVTITFLPTPVEAPKPEQ